MLTPPDPISGPAASTAAYERLRQFAIANSLTSGNGGGGLRKAFGGGSVFALPERKRNRPSLGSVSTHPFKLSDASEGATLKVKILPGMVNGQLPTGWDAVDGFTSAGLTASSWVWLKCVGTFGTPDTYVVTVESTTSASMPTGTAISTTGFTSFQLLGTVTIGGSPGAITSAFNNITTNQRVESFGSVNEWGSMV